MTLLGFSVIVFNPIPFGKLGFFNYQWVFHLLDYWMCLSVQMLTKKEDILSSCFYHFILGHYPKQASKQQQKCRDLKAG